MNKKLTIYLAVLPLFSFLVACAQLGPVNSTDIANQNAKTHREHNNLATYYEGVAQQMQANADQKKALLNDYEEHSYYYGRGGQDLKSHTEANLRYYEEAAQEAIKKADYHRKIAAELLQREYAESKDTPESTNAKKIKVKLKSDSDNLN